MAWLGPAVRWPDAIGINSTEALSAVQPRLPAPLNALEPELLFSLLVSFSLIALVTTAIFVLQARSRHVSLTQPVLASSQRRRRGAGDTPTVLLAGPSGVGKTSLYSALAFKAVPSVHPSQRESDSVVKLSSRGRSDGSAQQSLGADGTAVRIIDTPGHPRIKDGIIGEYIASADCLVVCIDAKEALKGGAGASKDSPLIEAVDHLHAVLVQLAKSRRRAKKSADPPRLVILFTRSDLSPHLANVSLGSKESEDVTADEGKRRAILTNRARTAVETELGRRRAGMGFGARRTTKVGGMGKVTGGEQSNSIWASIRSILGLGGSASPKGGFDADDEGDEDDGETLDYVDWDTLERMAARSASGGQANGASLASSSTSLERLDPDVVWNGRAICAFASVGKDRGWAEREVGGVEEFERILAEL